MSIEAMILNAEEKLEKALDELDYYQSQVKQLRKKLKDLNLQLIDEQNGVAA